MKLFNPSEMAASRNRQNRTSVVMLISLLATSGCQGLGQSSQSDFIRPLASRSNDRHSDSMMPKTERELCQRTASSVAKSGHLTEAIALYENAERLEPDKEAFDRQLAPLYAQSGQTDKAIERYQKAIAGSPKDIDLQNNFAWTLIEHGQIEKAIEILDSALVRSPDHPRLQSTRAIALYHRGDRQGALRQFEKVHGISAAHHNLALLDVESGDESNARVEVNRALAQSPTSKTIQLASAID